MLEEVNLPLDASSDFLGLRSQQQQHHIPHYPSTFFSSRYIRSEDDSIMAPPETTRLDAEVERLKQQFGTVSTEKEIEAASHYCSMLRNSKEDELKDKIWRQYLRRHCDTDRVWNEIAIYRLLGRNSRFFVRGQHLDSMALEDLRCALELWVSLAVEGGLTPFLQHEEVKTIYEGDGSAAEVFRAYIDTYRTKAGIHEWKREYMSELRYTIYERVRGIRASKEESSPGNPPPFGNAVRSWAS